MIRLSLEGSVGEFRSANLLKTLKKKSAFLGKKQLPSYSE